MAMAASRLNIIGDSGLGEPEQDANSALTELDKGLRSGNVGEQCEAIVRFPRLFEKYPFPILINSSFLKLADVFRVGSNFMRVWVLRVCQQSERHLDKILNVDEFVRRVFSVTHSNDPVARALALHVLGSVASIIPEREQVHHAIRNSLESHDTVEVLAAVCSAAKFAAHSRTFAVSMCNKIAAMIQGLDTPAELKLKLIPVLQHMHYTTSTAAMVRELGGELLQSYPAKDFILTSHDTLTKLAAEALVDIPHQVTLLLSSLEGEPRVEVQLHILRELKILAREGATHWPAGAVATLLARAQEKATSAKGSPMLASCLDVLSVLAKSATICHDQLQPDSALMELCIQSCYSLQPKIVSKAICILTNISCYCYEAGLPPLPAGASLEGALESFLLLLVSQGRPARHLRELTLCLKCVLQLCEACPSRCQFFVQLISEQMHGHMHQRDQTMLLLMETLAAIASISPSKAEPPILLHMLPELLSCISSMPSDAEQGSLICTLVFQTCQGYSLTPEICTTIYQYSQRCPVWECYKLARVSMRYGQHMFAVPAITRLTHSVSSEHFHFWLMCLKEISLAECALLGEKPVSLENMARSNVSPAFSETRSILGTTGSLIERLTQATTHYAKAIASMKAASSPHNWLQFATEYLRLRCDTLQCLSQLVQASLSLSHPPPAIAMNQAQTSSDELLRHGRTTTQLRKVAQEFRLIADNHSKLAQSAFDADPKTLANLKILKNLCLLMSRSIDSIATTNYQERNMIDFESVKDCPEMHHLVTSCNHAAKISEDVNSNRALKPISHQHIEALLQQVEIFATSPLCLPRYFFQVLQSTTVKLSISPQSRLVGEITVQANSQMVLRVEGVCQHQGRPGLFRSITGIKLALSSALQSSRTSEATKDSSSNITQVVHPHHDFFSAQFLLSFSQGGQYQICITASVIDAEGRVWRTGPKTFLVVKVYEDQSAASTAAIQALGKSFPSSTGDQASGNSRAAVPPPRF